MRVISLKCYEETSQKTWEDSSIFTCAVDAVNVDVDGGSSEHCHDVLGVLFLDFIFKDDFVRKSDPPLARIVPGEYGRSAAHFRREIQITLSN